MARPWAELHAPRAPVLLPDGPVLRLQEHTPRVYCLGVCSETCASHELYVSWHVAIGTLVLLPGGTIYARTHHPLFDCRMCCKEYITLTHSCQADILLVWERNRNKLPCGLPRKTWRPLRVFGNYTGATQMWQQSGWPCACWHGKSNLHPSPLLQGMPIHPPDESGGFLGRHGKEQEAR